MSDELQIKAGETVLSGGDLGGTVVKDWEIGTVKSFEYEGQTLWYRNDDGLHAVFCGYVEPGTEVL